MRRIAYAAVPNTTAVPLGLTGYAWNVEMVRERLPNHPMDSSDVLFDPESFEARRLRRHAARRPDRPVSHGAGLSRPRPNAVDDESLAAAEAQIKLVRPYIRYFSNQKMMSDLPNKEVCVAMSWSGDYAQAAARAEEAGIDIDLRYTAPKEGSGSGWTACTYRADAPNRDTAYNVPGFHDAPGHRGGERTTRTMRMRMPHHGELMAPEILENPAVFPDAATWEILYPIKTADPKRERPRTRAFARAKSGI